MCPPDGAPLSIAAAHPPQVGFVAIFMAPPLGARTDASLPAPLAWLPRFVLFKLMLMSGAVSSAACDAAYRGGLLPHAH